MTPIERIRAALNSTNGQAWLHVIREKESTQRPIAYRVLYGWHPVARPDRVFDSFADHPRVYFRLADGRRTSAAGAYQATFRTWSEVRRLWPGVFSSFDPGMQDLFAMERTSARGALEAVSLGRIAEVCHACRQEWTSLPGGPEQLQTVEDAERVFRQWGGRLA